MKTASQLLAPDTDGHTEPPLQQAVETETPRGRPTRQRRCRLLLAESARCGYRRILVLESLGRDERVECQYQTDQERRPVERREMGQVGSRPPAHLRLAHETRQVQSRWV